MALTESQQLAFAKWLKEVLKENKTDIENAKPGVSFDVDGHVTLITGKETAYDGEEGKVAKLEQQKQEQVKVANTKLKDLYNTASSSAASVVGHVGKDSKLGKLIINKRDSMSNEAARGTDSPTPR